MSALVAADDIDLESFGKKKKKKKKEALNLEELDEALPKEVSFKPCGHHVWKP